EFSLPVPDDEGPPGRRRKRRSSGLSILIFGVLLVGAAAGAGRILGQRAQDRRANLGATPDPANPVAAGTADAGAATATATPAPRQGPRGRRPTKRNGGGRRSGGGRATGPSSSGRRKLPPTAAPPSLAATTRPRRPSTRTSPSTISRA